MKAFSKILIILLCCFFLFQQNTYAKKGNFHILKDKKAVAIPFKFINKNIIVPITINDSDTLFFMIDSGLTHTLITQLFPEDSLQLNNTDEETIKGLGGDETLNVVISYNNTIKLKGITGIQQRINFIKEDIFNLSQLAGHKINGIIGYDFLKHFIIKIDYRRHILTLYNPKYYRKKLRRYIHFPLEIIAGKPYLRTDIIAPDNKRKRLKLMLDTGASLGLWLMDNNHTHIPKPEKTISTYLGQGLSGKIHGEYGRIPKLFFKNKTLKNVLTAYPDAEDVQGVTNEKRNGSIGSEILRRFYVILDYPNKRIALKPNSFFKEPFDFNLSGIEFFQPNLAIPFYKIYSIRENSPADSAGVKTGDIILEINGKKTVTMTLHKVINTLEHLEKKGKGVQLLVQRNDSIFKITYKIPKEIL